MERGKKAEINVTETGLADAVRESVMRKPWLIQRLLMPDERLPLGNPFSFGAGYKNGGLSDEANEALNKVFSFAYMGAAEYEWGAIPTSLGKIFEMNKQHEIATGVLKLEEGDVFYFCNSKIEKGVREVIKRIAHGGIRTRDYVGVREALKNNERKHGDLAGWLELDNHFMFFVDEEMFLKSAKLMGIGAASLGTQALTKTQKR
ncbi:MAG: hypothetical protein KGH57_00295 [Candidatus Micrarchaeota archaeon]|nr:hypothetical protein [Candidatus Micrarchaeota archaeon]